MPLFQNITDDLKAAMKSRDELRTSCLRMLKTSIKNRQIEKGSTLEDDEIQFLISSQVRKGQESAKEFRNGGREDLAVKEEKEIEILFGYLPKQLTSDEIEDLLKEIITELPADGMKDMGKVMKVAMARIGGKAQGKKVNEIARKLLS
jgi:uncharacterized protein YqeY